MSQFPADTERPHMEVCPECGRRSLYALYEYTWCSFTDCGYTTGV